jgi:Holliday junction resolvasome RuvABC endonuclease subunit
MGADLTTDVFDSTGKPAPKYASAMHRGRRASRHQEAAATPRMPLVAVVAPVGTVYLGVDLGLRLGWALLDHRGRRMDSGVLRLDRYPTAALRAKQARERIAGLLALPRNGHTSTVAYELVRRHEGVEAAHVYGGLQWMLLAALAGERLVPIEVAEVKRTATGRGNAAKSEMLAAAGIRWGCDAARDDNEADALWIAEAARIRVASRREGR